MSLHEGVTVEQFHLYGDLDHREQLLASLDSQQWPADESREIIVIRQIEVAGAWWEIGQRIADASQELWREGRSNSSASIEENEHIKVFRSHADVVLQFAEACLQRKVDAWYWPLVLDKPHAVPDDIASLLAVDHFVTVPVLLDHLVKNKTLNRLIECVEPLTWKTIYRAQCFQLGISATEQTELARYLKNLDFELVDSIVKAPEQSIVTWLKAQHQLNSHCGEIVPLMVLNFVWKTKPHALHSAQSVVQEIESAIDLRQQSLQSERIQTSFEASTYQPINERELESSSNEHSEGYGKDLNAPIIDANEVLNDSTEQIFCTEQAAVLYLVNVINRLRLQNDVLDAQESPWLFLYQLASSLTGLDESCVSFFAHVTGLEKEALENASALPKEHTIYKRISTFFDSTGLWNRSLIEVPGKLVVEGPSITNDHGFISSPK